MRYYFIVTLFFISCQNLRENESPKVIYFPNGKVKEIKYFKNGLLHGECFWFYPNGKLEQKATYLNGKANGYVYFFYESGALMSSRIYKRGRPVGYTTNYYNNSIGLIKSIFIFNENGQLIYKKELDTLGAVIKEEGQY